MSISVDGGLYISLYYDSKGIHAHGAKGAIMAKFIIVPPRRDQCFNVGKRVRLYPIPGVIPDDITGTIVEGMRIGFDLRVQWDDEVKRGKFDGWHHFSSLEEIREGNVITCCPDCGDPQCSNSRSTAELNTFNSVKRYSP